MEVVKKKEEEDLIQLLYSRNLITEQQKEQLNKHPTNDRIQGAVLGYEYGTSSLIELANNLQDILTLMPVNKRIRDEDIEEDCSSEEDDLDWDGNGSSDLDASTYDGDEEGDSKIEEPFPDFGEELEPNFDIDGLKLLKDPIYTLNKVNEVLEKNCEQKKKRQRRLEYLWDLITENNPAPPLPETCFQKK